MKRSGAGRSAIRLRRPQPHYAGAAFVPDASGPMKEEKGRSSLED